MNVDERCRLYVLFVFMSDVGEPTLTRTRKRAPKQPSWSSRKMENPPFGTLARYTLGRPSSGSLLLVGLFVCLCTFWFYLLTADFYQTRRRMVGNGYSSPSQLT